MIDIDAPNSDVTRADIGLTPSSWVSVNKTALKANYEAISSYLSGTKPQIIAVVKANAYGHDAVQTSKLFMECGASFFGTTTAGEAILLRRNRITANILVFSPPLQTQIAELIGNNVSITACDIEDLKTISNTANTIGRKAKIHLKIDTGMGRLGCLPSEAMDLARYIQVSEHLVFEGIFTHFGRALEQDQRPTANQFKTFVETLKSIRSAGIDYGIRHCANSAGILINKEYWLDAVRPGTILYGQYPSKTLKRPIELKDTWRFNTRIVSIRQVNAGMPIGYGAEFTTKRPSRLAVIPVGYADGFTVSPASLTSGIRGVKSIMRSLIKGNDLSVTVNSIKAPVLGRVAMQLTTIDITDIENVAVGDIVTVPCRRLNTNALIPRIFE